MAASVKRAFKKGDIIIREGDRGDCAYIIEQGNVEILVNKNDHLLQIGTRGAGSIIGEMAMIDDKPRTATIRALDDCHMLEISQDDFSRRIEQSDPILRMAMTVILTRYRDMIARTHGFLPSTTHAAEALENDNKTHNDALQSIKVDNELRDALNCGELMLYYQPIIDLQNLKIAGFEALMRWKHPEKGMISPGVFIPVAEESGMIVELSRWALGVSCDAVQALQAAATPALLTADPLFVSVNFSVKDFADNDFFDNISATLKNKSTNAAQITLEITESLLMEAPEMAKIALEKCRDSGLSVAIDDFGSGYSSLSYLHYFPVDKLKIDQSFIRSMTSNNGSLVLVKSIVALARNLNMKIVAEGIETAEEARIIRDMGCEMCQGYWFAKPMPLADALTFVRDWKPPAVSAGELIKE
jgi:EAL domain-containing protein (putative c-di-GMP-specific phosphodiesterase class I)